MSHHEAGRRFDIDRRTVTKMLSYSTPDGSRLNAALDLVEVHLDGQGDRLHVQALGRLRPFP